MKAAFLACALAALTPAAFAQPGQNNIKPEVAGTIAVPHCGADVSATSLYGFQLGSTQTEALATAHCRSQGGAIIDRPFSRTISYREGTDTLVRYFLGED